MIFPIGHGNPAGEVHYHYEDVEFRLPDSQRLSGWIMDIVQNEGQTLDVVNYIFCSDEYLHRINLQYLNHDTYTDIITFPLSDTYIESDIFISIDRVIDNALLHNATFEEELRRVIIHGILHLCGYADKTPEDQALMTTKENEALSLLANPPAPPS